jgi:hypothetical protein
VIEPLEHAFDVWRAKASLWWPHGHSVSGDPRLTVTVEPRAGGRIYECTPAGVEHDWGEVLLWEPPHPLAWLCHLRFHRSDATESRSRSRPRTGARRSRSSTAAGSAAAGKGPERRDRNKRGWAGLPPRSIAACAATV